MIHLEQEINYLQEQLKRNDNWNEYLQRKLERVENLLYKKVGLIQQEDNLKGSDDLPEPIKNETWATARAKLERLHKKHNNEPPTQTTT